MRRKLADDGVDDAGRHHQPDGAGRVELPDELLEGRRRARVDVRVERLQVVTGGAQALGHVRPHPAETDHPELHR